MKWWRHRMETFSALLAVCAGNSLVIGEVPSQRPVTSFDAFFYLRLSKQSRRRWFETPSRSLCCHCVELVVGIHCTGFKKHDRCIVARSTLYHWVDYLIGMQVCLKEQCKCDILQVRLSIRFLEVLCNIRLHICMTMYELHKRTEQ